MYPDKRFIERGEKAGIYYDPNFMCWRYRDPKKTYILTGEEDIRCRWIREEKAARAAGFVAYWEQSVGFSGDVKEKQYQSEALFQLKIGSNLKPDDNKDINRD